MEKSPEDLQKLIDELNSDIHPILGQLQQWIGEQEVVRDAISKAKSRKMDVERYESKSNELLIETKLLVDVMREKIKQYTLLQYEVLLKFMPQLSRKEDERAYERLTSVKIHPLKKPDSRKILKQQTDTLQKNFKTEFKSFQKLFEYLVNEKILSRDANIQVFFKMAKLEAIERQERLVWIHKTGGKISSQTIAVLIFNIFMLQAAKKHGNENLEYLVLHYFVPLSGEFKQGTLKTKFSALRCETLDLNHLEQNLTDFIQKDFSS